MTIGLCLFLIIDVALIHELSIFLLTSDIKYFVACAREGEKEKEGEN